MDARSILEHVASADFTPALERLRSLELDVNTLQDEHGNPVLVLACLQLEQEQQPADTTEMSVARAQFVRELLARGAHVDSVDTLGRTATLCCVLQGEHRALRWLCAASPPPNLLQRGGQAATSPLGAAYANGCPRVIAIIEEAAARCGLSHLASQERAAAEMSALMDALCDRMEEELVAGGGEGDDGGYAPLLLEQLGLSSELRTNPLERARDDLCERMPLVHRKGWRQRADLTDPDLEIVRSLHAVGAADGRPMLCRLAEPYIARAAGAASWLVTPECHRFNQLCFRPLQRRFSCGAPASAARGHRCDR